MPKSHASRGRPPLASRELLQEAAFELFLEQGYEHTTVADIATRAGVGRSTFFNHFATKSDVFWTELDAAGDTLERELAHPQRQGFDAVRQALTATAASLGPERVPFVLTQHELIGSPGELQSAAVTRLTRFAALIERRLEHDQVPAAIAAAAAYALVAASVAAARSWASAGLERGPLTPYLATATEPILTGFWAS